MSESNNSQFNKNSAKQVDEHDEPTEPLYPVVSPAFLPTVPDNAATSYSAVVPSPAPKEQPFPHQQVQVPPESPSPYFPASGIYPYTPPIPNPSNGNQQVGSGAATQVGQNNQPLAKPRRSFIPISVGMFFVAVQMLLLLRFLLKLLNQSANTFWIDVIYGISNVFVLPFHLLFLQTALPVLMNIELYTLLAILVYGIISRIVVHILKILFRMR